MGYAAEAAGAGTRISGRTLAAFGLCLLPAAIASANGGYFPTSWGWAALGFAWVAALAAGLATRPLGGPSLLQVAPLLVLEVLTFVSAAWSPVPSASFAAGEQMLVLVTGVLAFAVLVDRDNLRAAALALVAGDALVSTYALATRLLPGHVLGDALSGNRLYRPVGYWNGLGIYAVLALLLAVCLLVQARPVERACLAFVVPILATTVYFTYSRGSAIACAIGLVVAFALSPSRSAWLARAVAVAVPAAAAVIVASRSHALTTAGATHHAISSQGHRLAVVVLVLAVVSALLALAPAFGRGERLVTVAVTAALVVALVAGLVAVGGPSGIWDKFKAPPPVTHGNLNKRLFSFSGSARTPLWSAAVHEYEKHPVLGGGAGSYETYYLQHRSDAAKVRNAHNLYLETLAELGPLGLALLLVALLSPLPFVRREPLVAGLAAAYVAFLAHVLVDWDWQLTGVAVTALACGGGILVAARGDRGRGARVPLLALSVTAIVVAFVVLAGNLYLGRAQSAAHRGDWAASARDAKRARTWAPWSAEPWRLLGEAQLGLGERASATASFHKAIAKSRDDWSLWFDLARASLGRPQQSALARAAHLNPRSPEIAELRRELASEKQITVTGS